MTALSETAPRSTVALVTLGCARNEVDSEELAGRLEAGGFRLVGTLENVGFKFGRWLDSVLMQRPLGQGASLPPSGGEEWRNS